MVSLPTLTGRRWGMSESTVKRFYGSNEPDALETAYAINDAGQIVGRRSAGNNAFHAFEFVNDNRLVMDPGRYRFKHYLSIGSGMAVIAWLLTAIVTPMIWRF
jgi:probable HAF family extracellular repeat protein